MDNECLYRDYEINLQKLSSMLLVTPHQLSEFLNKNLNMSFANYINKFRIEEAVRLIENEPNNSILSICFHVGFSSKSSFNRAFKKFTGKNPIDLRVD